MRKNHRAPEMRKQFRRTLTISAAALTVALLSVLPVQPGPAAGAAPKPPVPLEVLSSHAARGSGYIFVSPGGPGVTTYTLGPQILDREGNLVWFHPVPLSQQVLDFRAQTYQGKPVLTWWQGTGAGELSKGVGYIYDARHRLVATVRAGNGLDADCHEFLITPWDTALITIYTTADADLRSIGGPPDQTVVNGVVQEIDIATGEVLFEWNSADHVPFSESRQPLPESADTPWDWFHVNAAHLDTDDNLLIDARHTWATYKVDRASGDIIWTLGGDNNTFTLRAAPGQELNSDGQIFAWQHDPEALGNGLYTWFDNESSETGWDPLGYSRVVTVRVDEERRIATLVASIEQPDRLSAVSQGNAQTTHGKRVFVGWGSLPYISQFDRAGRLLFHARFPEGVSTYRAYLLPWKPKPARPHP
jgi:hypothetical protein